MTRKMPAVMRKPAASPAGYAGIHGGIVELLDAARQAAARSVNALMTASYWEIGRRIVEAEQKGKRRAGYGEQLMERLSADLTARFGRGLGVNNLESMRRFFLAYPQPQISQTLSGKLGNELPAEKSQTVSRKFDLSERSQYALGIEQQRGIGCRHPRQACHQKQRPHHAACYDSPSKPSHLISLQGDCGSFRNQPVDQQADTRAEVENACHQPGTGMLQQHLDCWCTCSK